eukprot:TRINITY_DN7586_c0_g1_i18.p2 TRINITY_DN7586_c0_g1~~TRINITY_DN7586_c0_g1_i18.p2  ORF type:complete len:114 (+),score=24.21 TRINITY_DN7586_c0_g1_i18:341-682(+)
MVDRKEKEEHEESKHKPVPCQHCSASYEARQIQEHAQNCNMRPKQCPYCELELSHDKYMEHIVLCGSRTEQCPKCGKFIRKADWMLHQESSCGLNATEEFKREGADKVAVTDL